MVNNGGSGGGGGGDFPWPWSVKELMGRKVQIVHPGDKVMQKDQPGIVTIYVTEDDRISNIKIEPSESI